MEDIIHALLKENRKNYDYYDFQIEEAKKDNIDLECDYVKHRISMRNYYMGSVDVLIELLEKINE